MGGLLVEIFVACMCVFHTRPHERQLTAHASPCRLYGITTLQTLIYYQKYPRDRTFLKLLVGTVW